VTTALASISGLHAESGMNGRQRSIRIWCT
jgi:hypothetical protein